MLGRNCSRFVQKGGKAIWFDEMTSSRTFQIYCQVIGLQEMLLLWKDTGAGVRILRGR